MLPTIHAIQGDQRSVPVCSKRTTQMSATWLVEMATSRPITWLISEVGRYGNTEQDPQGTKPRGGGRGQSQGGQAQGGGASSGGQSAWTPTIYIVFKLSLCLDFSSVWETKNGGAAIHDARHFISLRAPGTMSVLRLVNSSYEHSVPLNTCPAELFASCSSNDEKYWYL